MWFKNIQLYLLNAPFPMTAEALDSALARSAFAPCGKEQLVSSGWVPALPGSGLFAHANNGCVLMCLRKEEKMLPAAVVKRMSEEKIREAERDKGRRLKRAEKAEIVYRVKLGLIPRAFTRISDLSGYVDLLNQRIVINTGSRKQAEEFASKLRDVVGPLSARLPMLQQATDTTMTAWLKNQTAPAKFTVLDECVLKEPGADGAEVRCKRVDVFGHEVSQHLGTGKHVVALALQWNDRVRFVLDRELTIRRLKFGLAVEEELSAVEAASELDLLDAEFGLMTAEIESCVTDLFATMGGVVPSEEVDEAA